MTPGRDFDEFFAASWPRLLRATVGVTGDMSRAEDALQAAYAKAFVHWSSVVRADDPLAYVRRIAINSALADGRKAFRRREVTSEHLPERTSPLADEPDEVWSLLATLPPRQRAVLVLRYYEDLSELEIASVLQIRPGTVKSHASAGLRALRERVSAAAIQGERS